MQTDATDKPHTCDWPHCEATRPEITTFEQYMQDRWCKCCSHEDIKFLPDPCLLCPEHGEMYEEIACNPGLLEHCMYPGCTEEPIVPAEDGKWLCVNHAHERMNSPRNRALTQASADLDDFLDGGGKVS